ncbi:MAG: hypothetical protein CMP63_07890 [Flavobacteriales bacterium]|nr:hypothetical protein [Flavobacteriales bacterium]
MSFYRLKIFIIVLFCAFKIKAQTGEIYGTVINIDGDSIGAAFVSLFKEGNQIDAVYSDFDGAYFFSGIDPGSYDVTIESLGFQIKTIQGVLVGTNQKVELNFTLLSSSREVDVVEIIQYRKPLIDKDKQAKIYTAVEIENLAVRDVEDIVSTSVDAVSQDDGSGDVYIRGQRTEGTQFIVDGIKINGKLSIPQNAIEQVEVISGGIPAMYGDNIGGVVIITTKGGGSKGYGAFESVTSNGLDGYGYNLATGSYAGPILRGKKDSNGILIKPSPLRFLFTGEFKNLMDSRPSALGVWRIDDDVLHDLEVNPLRVASSGMGTLRNSEFVTSDDFKWQKANQNVSGTNSRFAGKIDCQLNKNILVTTGGNHNYSKGNSYIYDYSLFNSVNNPEYINHQTNLFFRWKQKFNVDSLKWISSLSYQIQVDYTEKKSLNWDDSHKDDLFKYGHVGQFKTHRSSLYEYEEDGENGDAYYYKGEKDILYDFLGGGSNPNASNYASQFYSLYAGLEEGNYENYLQASNGGALLNGDRPEHVYGIWYNTGRQYNGYSKSNSNQKRVIGNITGKIFKKHNIVAGFEYEEREYRNYSVSPIGLWNRMRQLSNSKNTELDLDNPFLTSSNGVFTDTVNYSYLYQETGGKGFYENVRDQFGLAYSEYFDSDFYGPESYSLSLFSPDELFAEGNGVLSTQGYDYLGNPISTSALYDFFHEKDENGAYTRKTNPYQPIYASGYIQDKFQFDNIVFNIGIRVDRFDANQPVLKDPYVLYDAFKVKDLNSTYSVPNTIDEEATVYVSSLEMETPSIVGYRLGNSWFDESGKEITDPSVIEEASSSGEVTPFLKDPSIKIGDSNYDPSSTFKDYESQYSFMPRISFTFNLSENSSFFAHYDVLTQRPALSQNMFNPIDYLFLEGNVGTFVRNSNLKPQKTIDYEVGYKQALTIRSAVTVSTYYREMKDLIQITAINYAYPVNYLTFGNLDKALVKGFSVKYDLRPINSNVSLNAGYTLQFADGTGSSPVSSASLISQGVPDLKIMLPLTFDQRHIIRGVFNYAFQPGKKYIGPDWNGKGRAILGGLSTNIVTKLSSGRPYTGQSNFTPEGNIINAERRALDGLINGNRLPWIYTTDARVSKKFVFGLRKESSYRFKTEFYLVVKNLFDTKNIVNVYNATGNPEDDGYLDAATSQSNIVAQTNYESYLDLYSLKIANPNNYALPRQIRIGFVMTF